MAMATYTEVRDRLDEFLLEHRKRLLAGLAAVMVGAALMGAGYWWIRVRWHPPPSIFDSPVEDVLGYLALDDFSQLPLKERVRFLLEFADRFRGMSQSDSAILAGFVAGINGPARAQLTENVRELGKDILIEGAQKYLEVAESERGKFLDDWLLEWMKTGERIATGKVDDKPDGERLKDLKADAKKDALRPRDPTKLPTLNNKGASRFLDFWSSDVEKTASPKEQGQITHFMVDLRKHILK